MKNLLLGLCISLIGFSSLATAKITYLSCPYLENYLLVAVVLFLAGIFISFSGRKKSLQEVDFTKIESFSSDDFVSLKDGEPCLNILAVDNLAMMFLKKHGSSSVNDILFMNMPLIDRLEQGLPEPLRKDFKSTLKRRLKDNC